MNESHITIIVPAYNAEKTIRKCIESFLGIDYPKYDIIIIDDGSTDKTLEIISEYKDKLTIIRNQHSGPSKCRNDAAKISKVGFLAFTDSDCVVDKNWLNELIKGFVNEKIVGVGGVQLSPQDETKFGRSVQSFFELTGFLGGYIKHNEYPESSIEDQNLRIREVSHNPSCNAMYRKDIFLEVGGFDETLWPSEDVDLDYRLKKKGYKFMFNPEAIVYHYRPQSLSHLSNMMYRYGVTQGILTKRYGFFRAIQFVPFLILSFLALLFINLNFLWVLVILYSFLVVKYRQFLVGSMIFVFLLVSCLEWNIGLIAGIFFRKK